MSMFLGTHQNRFDAKGRVSIPAPFRTALRAQAQPGDPLVILRPSHLHPCIEGWTVGAFASLATPLDEYDPFSEDHEDLAASLYADAYPLDSDKEGRIILPETLRTHAALVDEVSFMGLGRTFQIWNPVAAAERRQAARSRAKTLATSRRPGSAPPMTTNGAPE
ncbi:division/cell wall cluster transcriptional repressor MraZ [Gluconobacter kanchanaburiensis]|uniref:Transcriptional regulator MraZ n=1 Tax=Gluconobacter kanchanaburiensis NBRC 103587 TaxID=1307948 RepID=A0A511BC00_9PROT|nr:division/cell wall cluster transcriptional repressor MraZ [Gluconobacter kanchanaburiensis]MBF0862961.1 division/cell wall cluster transcriptional repressor MraZ [Gluconobacter kanchanaburiensis]GBR70641.1 cell division protein MraZ [Gluconobacter kanchanaburiensis NBRC 103587]GEK97302.1 transcriptional regulator MraZ [Gluconobacter kanchanaburiensis NBRC 103587]